MQPTHHHYFCKKAFRLSRISRQRRVFLTDFTAFFSDFGGDESRYSFHSDLTDRSTVVEIGGYTGVDIMAMKEGMVTFVWLYLNRYSMKRPGTTWNT
jgi:hypothetical protein